MVTVAPKEDPLRVKIERILVSPQEAVVLLASDNGDYSARVLPVFIDHGQAMNIQVSLEGRMIGRPLTHDLFSSVINELNAIVERVVIEEIAQNTFFATMHLEVDKAGKRTKVSFDARPSDGIALAVRAGAPIMVRRKVLDAAAVDRERFIGTAQQGASAEGEPETEFEEEEDAGEGPKPRKKGGPPRERLDPGDLERP